MEPRKIENREELDALPEHAVIVDDTNLALQKQQAYSSRPLSWVIAGYEIPLDSSAEIALPVLLVWLPDA